MSAETPRRQRLNADQAEPKPTSPNDRWHLLDKVKALRQLFKLNDRDITVLQAHLSVLPKGPVLQGNLNMSYMKVQDILERANGMDEKAFRRSEVRLEAAGLIIRKISANGRRFPVYQNNKIVTAYGIDLTPLIAKADNMDALITEKHSIEQERRALKTQISCQLQDYRRKLLETGSTSLDSLAAFICEIRNTLRRKSTSVTELQAIATRVIAYGHDLAIEEVPCPSRQAEYLEILPDKNNGDDGQYVRRIESQKKDTLNKTTHKQLFNASRGQLLWAEAPSLAEYFPQAPSQERQLADTLYQFSTFLGLRKETVTAAAVSLGWEKLGFCLHYLTIKLGSIKKPDAYLRSMLKRFQIGHCIAGGRISPHRDLFCRWESP